MPLPYDSTNHKGGIVPYKAPFSPIREGFSEGYEYATHNLLISGSKRHQGSIVDEGDYVNSVWSKSGIKYVPGNTDMDYDNILIQKQKSLRRQKNLKDSPGYTDEALYGLGMLAGSIPDVANIVPVAGQIGKAGLAARVGRGALEGMAPEVAKAPLYVEKYKHEQVESPKTMAAIEAGAAGVIGGGIALGAKMIGKMFNKAAVKTQEADINPNQVHIEEGALHDVIPMSERGDPIGDTPLLDVPPPDESIIVRNEMGDLQWDNYAENISPYERAQYLRDDYEPFSEQDVTRMNLVRHEENLISQRFARTQEELSALNQNRKHTPVTKETDTFINNTLVNHGPVRAINEVISQPNARVTVELNYAINSLVPNIVQKTLRKSKAEIAMNAVSRAKTEEQAVRFIQMEYVTANLKNAKGDADKIGLLPEEFNKFVNPEEIDGPVVVGGKTYKDVGEAMRDIDEQTIGTAEYIDELAIQQQEALDNVKLESVDDVDIEGPVTPDVEPIVKSTTSAEVPVKSKFEQAKEALHQCILDFGR